MPPLFLYLLSFYIYDYDIYIYYNMVLLSPAIFNEASASFAPQI